MFQFGLDGCGWTVARHHFCCTGEMSDALPERDHNLAGIAARQVRAADAVLEKRVSCEQEILVCEVQADGAFGVARGVQDSTGSRTDMDLHAFFGTGIGWGDFGCSDAEPRGLIVDHLDEWDIELVVEDRCPGDLRKTASARDVIDVRMGDDDLRAAQVVVGQALPDVGEVAARIDDNGFASGGVAHNRAITLKRADREDFVDHFFIRQQEIVSRE